MNKTPFARYLKRNKKTTAANIGRRMAKYLDHEPSSASLSQWTTGVVAPSASAQMAMSKATNGRVTPIEWTRWKAERKSS